MCGLRLRGIEVVGLFMHPCTIAPVSQLPPGQHGSFAAQADFFESTTAHLRARAAARSRRLRAADRPCKLCLEIRPCENSAGHVLVTCDLWTEERFSRPLLLKPLHASGWSESQAHERWLEEKGPNPARAIM